MTSLPENPNDGGLLTEVGKGLDIAKAVQEPDEQDKNESAALRSIQLDNDLKRASVLVHK